MLDGSSAKLVSVNIMLGNYNDGYSWIPSGINSVPRAFKILIALFFAGLLGWNVVICLVLVSLKSQPVMTFYGKIYIYF